MTPLVSNLWPQFMVDPAFAACFGQVIVEHAQMLRQERQVIFTLRSGAPLDKNLCARLLASLQPDYEGFELRIQNLFGYAMLDEAALRDLMEEMKRDGVPINGFLDRCKINIIGQKITIGVCHGTKFLQEMHFEKLLAERVAAHTGVTPQVTLQSAVSEAEQHQMEEKLERKIAPPVVKFEKKNTAPSIKVDGLDLTDKPVTIFHGKMFTPKNLTPLKDLGGEGGKCTIWGDVFFSEVKGLEPKMAFDIMEAVRKGKVAKGGFKDGWEEAMREHEVPDWYIESCRKIKYMFPKAHAVAYLMSAIRLMWFKIYRPPEFYAVYFTVRGDDIDYEAAVGGAAVARAHMEEVKRRLKEEKNAKDEDVLVSLQLVNEMLVRGYEFLPIELGKSRGSKYVVEDGKVRLPFSSLKGLGGAAADALEKVTIHGEEYISVEELQQASGVGSSILDRLRQVGALGDLPESSQVSFF